MKKKHKGQWQKSTAKLRPDHSWRAPPGYVVFVADRGAVRFNIPQGWLVIPEDDCVGIRDRQPPDDDCRLAMSYLHLAPIDWSGLPLTELVEAASREPVPEAVMLSLGSPVVEPRQDLELAWTERRFVDSREHREAFGRMALARGANLQALITFDFWVSDLARLAPVWAEVMRSVQLGRYVADPLKGDVLH